MTFPKTFFLWRGTSIHIGSCMYMKLSVMSFIQRVQINAEVILCLCYRPICNPARFKVGQPASKWAGPIHTTCYGLLQSQLVGQFRNHLVEQLWKWLDWHKCGTIHMYLTNLYSPVALTVHFEIPAWLLAGLTQMHLELAQLNTVHIEIAGLDGFETTDGATSGQHS